MKKLALHWQILIALVLAVLFGIFLPEQVSYISWMGDVFLRGLKMVIIPLILSSIITGVAGIGNSSNLGRVGAKTMGYYFLTSTLAIVTGLLLVNIIKPGLDSGIELKSSVDSVLGQHDTIGQTLIKIIPENIFQSFAKGDMLGIIFFALLFGFFLTKIKAEYREPTLKVVNGVFEVMMKITMFIIRFTPLGILGLVAGVVAEQKNIADVATGLGSYFLTVLIALLIHGVFTLLMITYFVGRVNPFRHFKAMSTPLLTAFSTSSSSATLPLTMEAVENNGGVSQKISSFTLPLGATVNMDGTALYECVAVIFIAQIYGMELSIVNQVMIVLLSLLASVGAAGIPMAGLVTITIILSYLGLPLEAVGLILAVDRPLDMLRTTVNVWSDSCGAVTIANSEGEKLNY
ncbi:dicarboxylate/amino acid:cation symporter [Saccharicrinis sp. FJH62]|uniref:dicarboxylate/amino acid:cation symporter n=1 Tax=Saccharicrinis sp. FJH62 TaxID=3344657 RepID=UPI0035D4D513